LPLPLRGVKPMPVHVDRVLTEVMPEAESPAASSQDGAPSPWEEADRFRAALAALERDKFRTRAEGFDG